MDASEFYRTLEAAVVDLAPEQKAAIYGRCAAACVKNTVMKEMRRQFEECGCSLDAQYERYGDTEFFHAEIVEPGHRYIVGYPRCLCPAVEAGIAASATHCECSRQSILYVLRHLLPGKEIEVTMLHTVLSRAENCRFAVTVK